MYAYIVTRILLLTALDWKSTVYGQTSRFVAAGLPVSISKKTDSAFLLENPNRSPNSKIQLEITTRELVCLPIAKNPATVCAPQLAVLELLRQLEGMYPS